MSMWSMRKSYRLFFSFTSFIHHKRLTWILIHPLEKTKQIISTKVFILLYLLLFSNTTWRATSHVCWSLPRWTFPRSSSSTGWLQQSSVINTDCLLRCPSPACSSSPPPRRSPPGSPGQQCTRMFYLTRSQENILKKLVLFCSWY